MLKLNHLTGFGSGVGAAAGADVTSYVLDGTGDYLSIPDHADWDFVSSDFTWECFIRIPTSPITSAELLWEQYEDNNNFNILFINDDDTIKWRIREAGAYEVDIEGDFSSTSADTWHHIAIVRQTNDYYWYIDGTDVTNSGSPDAFNAAARSGNVRISSRAAYSGGLAFTGYIDELRISDTYRYPDGTGFTPTITQFVSDANTLLLIHGGEAIASGTTGSGATFVDSGNTGHTVTENGNAIRDISIYKF